MGTQFSEIYNHFLGKITDDLYMELTPEDTLKDLQNLLINSIPNFEFPRKDFTKYTIEVVVMEEAETTSDDFIVGSVWGDTLDENGEIIPRVIVDKSAFVATLTPEEINLFALFMMQGWIQRQVASIENVRMKYSGPDFKMTSQANHLSKLLTLQAEIYREAFHMQRLYKRRRIMTDSNVYRSNWDVFHRTHYYGN